MKSSVAQAARALAHGEIVVAPTESFCALMANARDAAALDRVFELKGRSTSHAVALMIPDVAAWAQWVTEIPAWASSLAERFWPGPLTVTLPARAGVDPRLCVDGCVGVRIPGSSPALDVVRAYGGAVTATSANLSGQPAVLGVDGLHVAFRSARYVWGTPGAGAGGAPSTIVRDTSEGLCIVRPGAVTRAALEQWGGRPLANA